MPFRLYVNSANGVDVNVEYDFKDTGRKFESRHRVRSGAEYVYKWGEWTELKFSIAFVNSEFKSIVNSWWSSNTDLLWKEVDVAGITSVHLINKSKPVDRLVKPYNDLFRGKIELGTY